MGIYNKEKILMHLKATNFISDNKKYSLVKVSQADLDDILETLKSSKYKNQYLEIIYDKNELSVLMEAEEWNKIKGNFSTQNEISPLGIITCGVETDNPTGYLLTILELISKNDISVYVQGAYTTDHIFINYKDVNKTIKLLKESFN